MLHAPVLFLIDDDIDDQQIFSIALQNISSFIRFVIANNCKDALEKLSRDKSFQPDFIFLDLNMPGMSGLELLQHIKQKYAHPPAVVMMITAYGDPEN